MRLVLISLLAVFLLAEPAAAKKEKDSVPDGTVSVIHDDRVIESSGLALSAKHDDLVYTINDRGAHPMVYAIQVSTGDVVGVTDLAGFDVEDTESIAVDAQGTLWLGDLGDNDQQRDDVSIVAFPEPGPGTHHLTSGDRYGVRFPDGPVDVEGMLVDPNSGQVFLVSKNRDGLGTVYRLPALTPGATVVAEDLRVEAPQAVTDATFTHDGRWALLRTNNDVWMYDSTTWQPMGTVETPKLKQGESITSERGDRTVLLGSEGKKSPLVRVALPEQPTVAGPLAADDGGKKDGDQDDDDAAGFQTDGSTTLGFALGLIVILGVIGIAGRRRMRALSRTSSVRK